MVADERLVRPERVFSLDVLRGMALLLVLARHVPVAPEGEQLTERLLSLVVRTGWSGVDLFFVLSGYLISTLLFREGARTGRIRVARFLGRRGFKIYPSYYAAFGLMVAAEVIYKMILGRPIRADLAAILPNAIFIQNFLSPEIRWPHSWSIAIEEHFYLVVVLLFAFVVARRVNARGYERFKGLVAGGVVVCASTLALRIIVAGRPGVTWQSIYYPSQFRADALCFGVMLGYLHLTHRDRFERFGRTMWPLILALAAGAVLLILVFPLETSPFAYTWGFTILYLGYGGLVILAGTFPNLGRRSRSWILSAPAKSVAWIGVYSYTIYLVHAVIPRLPNAERFMFVLRERTIGSVWIDRFAFWGLSIAGGVALSHIVERPLLALRSKVLPRPETTAVSTQSRAELSI